MRGNWRKREGFPWYRKWAGGTKRRGDETTGRVGREVPGAGGAGRSFSNEWKVFFQWLENSERFFQ